MRHLALLLLLLHTTAPAPAPTITARWADATHARITVSQPWCISNQRVWIGCVDTEGSVVLPPRVGPHDAALEPFVGAIYCLETTSGAVVCDRLRSAVGLPWVGQSP